MLVVGGTCSPLQGIAADPSYVRPRRAYCAPMAEVGPITGELQTQIMAVVWRLGGGTVEQVRAALPPRYCGAYNTIQTVLNRLAERGMLSRHRGGNAIEYRPTLSEADYLSRSISQTLAGASVGARQAALAQVIGGLDKAELEDLQQLARQMRRKRRKR
jgi:predicted transcriptional regulator